MALRILANPCSNVFQKLLTGRQADPLFVVCATHALLSLVCLPICLWDLPQCPLSFWIDMVLCSVMAVAGNVLLVEAMKRSDLSVLGPINAFKSVVGLLAAWILLNELPGALPCAGVALIVAGSFGLADPSPQTPRRFALTTLLANRGVQLRFAALLVSATEAVVFKRAMRETSALTAFAVWAVFGFVVAVIAVLAKLGYAGVRTELARFRVNRGTYALLFLSTGLMQFCTAVTLERLQVGPTLALFQISTLLSVVLGHRVFQEEHFLKRIVGAGIMAAGAALIVWGR